jgi:molybdopterin-binding protein
MEFSARNIFKGKIKQLKSGPVHTEVVIELPGGQDITSIITSGSAERLGLTEGKEASAIVKASAVIVGVE